MSPGCFFGANKGWVPNLGDIVLTGEELFCFPCRFSVCPYHWAVYDSKRVRNDNAISNSSVVPQLTQPSSSSFKKKFPSFFFDVQVHLRWHEEVPQIRKGDLGTIFGNSWILYGKHKVNLISIQPALSKSQIL